MRHTNQPKLDQSLPRRSFMRACLQGTGVSLTLPWLGSLPVRAEETGKQITADNVIERPPIRLGVLFFSNGVEPEHWWAKKHAGGIQYGQALAPLQSHANDITFIKGLFNEQAASHPSPHMGRMANMLSGAWVSRDQSEIRAGRTFDQVLARQLGNTTEIPSLALGIEPTELRLEDGLSMIYGSCISWASDTQPATKEIYPARVYDLILGGGTDRKLDRSILDSLRSDAARIRQQVSASDKAKLDEYFASIRDIENRIDRAKKDDALEGWQPSIAEPTFGRPKDELPQDVAKHMELMLDLIVLAFQMDKTRIATCMLNNDLSQMNFGFLEGVEGSLHLDLTHNGREPELEAMYLKTNQFHSQQLAYLISRMKKIDEGESSLWDNTMLLFGSNLFNGDKHQATEMPLLLTGGASADLKHGGLIDVGQADIESRRACSLYLSLMDRMGLELPRFGDASQRLSL
ncbi:MAG: DUF1552 domain-containing protein [Pirellulaceae bacterium]